MFVVLCVFQPGLPTGRRSSAGTPQSSLLGDQSFSTNLQLLGNESFLDHLPTGQETPPLALSTPQPSQTGDDTPKGESSEEEES